MPAPVVLITGAGGGVGRALTLRFAADGFSVACLGRSESSLRETVASIPSAAAPVAALPCDVADRHALARVVRQVAERLGEVDVLVNNAAIAESAPFVSMDDELWDRTIGVNLTGAYNCMRAVAPGMFARRRGRIINIASTAARVGFAYTAAYVASKHGLLGLTRAVAIEAQARGVTVNAICPGWLDTDMTRRTIARIAERTGRTADEATRALAEMNAGRRLIRPEEVAAVAAYLASPEAADVNGQDLDVP